MSRNNQSNIGRPIRAAARFDQAPLSSPPRDWGELIAPLVVVIAATLVGILMVAAASMLRNPLGVPTLLPIVVTFGATIMVVSLVYLSAVAIRVRRQARWERLAHEIAQREPDLLDEQRQRWEAQLRDTDPRS